MANELKNYHLEVLGKVLNYPMAFQDGRIKMRFLKVFSDQQEIVKKSREEMLSDLCDKNEKGKPIMESVKSPIGSSMQYKLSPENLAKFHQEFTILMNEVIPVVLPADVKANLGKIKEFINKSQENIDNRETLVLDEIMEVLDFMSK